MDRAVVEQKLEALRRCLQRIEQKRPASVEALQADEDVQDILTFNLTRAVQLCVDIGMHIIADKESAAPETMGETFDVLAQTGVLDRARVGVRSRIVTSSKRHVMALITGKSQLAGKANTLRLDVIMRDLTPVR